MYDSVITQFDWSVRGQYFPVLPAPVETLVIACADSDAEVNKSIIAIPQVNLKRNISLYCPPSHAKIYIYSNPQSENETVHPNLSSLSSLWQCPRLPFIITTAIVKCSDYCYMFEVTS